MNITCLVKSIKTGGKVAISRYDVEDWIICNSKTGTRIGYYSEFEKGGEVAVGRGI